MTGSAGDAWDEQHAPRPGDIIQIRGFDGEVDSQTFEVIDAGALPAEDYGDALDWKRYWQAIVECPARCGCEGEIMPDGKCRHLFLLAADEFVKVGSR